ncbi:MAG TPA: Nramp family divalent metal transporter, partial [Methylomirabilota bacterium]|nr:Nramp family divalent metal transporter [Methylomirabilota bacterium]
MSELPVWRQGDLPHPPAFGVLNVVRVIGPAAILLGVSLGAGDWLLGPAVIVRYGPSLFWICTLSVLLQAMLNTEMARYTLATGEPVFTGFMRTRPGMRFWAWTYSALHLAQTGWPGWALAGGSALAALLLGRVPRDEDRVVVLGLGYVLFLSAVGILLLGEAVHRLVERAEWLIMAWMVLFLLAVGVFLVPSLVWKQIASGFVAPLADGRWLPVDVRWRDVDWALVAAFAAYSGAGGTINATLTHWMRDKGFGMAGTVGVTPTVIGGQKVPLAREGAVFPPTAENLAKWKQWWRYVRADFWYLGIAGCLIGMALPAVLTLHFLTPGSEMGGPGAAAVLPRAMGDRAGLALWLLGLLTGLWIFFSTQLGIIEGFARSVTDILWAGGAARRAGGAARLYYAVLGVFTL